MSPPSSVPRSPPSPASVRSNAPQTPVLSAALPSSPPRDDVPPKTLLHAGRSKTAPLALDHLWTPSVDQPQLSERDSIFATTYRPSDSLSSSPRSPARTLDARYHGPDHDRSDMAVAVPAPRRLTEASIQHRTPPAPSTLQDHQGLLSTRFNSSRRDHVGMSSAAAPESPPPFMSPVDSPVHRPTSPPHPVQTPAPLDDRLAETEERIKNRLWREGKPEAYLPHKGVGHNLVRDGHVDKKIEATLAKTEQPPAARSRKASHYLRVFKENDAAEQQKKREGRAKERRPTEKSLPAHQEEGSVRSDTSNLTEQLQRISRASSAVQSPQNGPLESYFDRVPTPGSEERSSHIKPNETTYRQEFPARLLEEIRNHHNLTPGADRGSSFSRSLPTAAAEKLRGFTLKARPTSQIHEPSEYFHSPRDDSVERSHGSEEDDSDREQISSALYFPHRQLKSPEAVPQDDAEEARKAEIEAVRKRSSISTGKGLKEWGRGETVKTPQEVEISLQSQDTNQCLHGDIPPTSALRQDASSKPLPSAHPAEASPSAESGYESLAESLHSRGDESSATDDLGTTPTAAHAHKQEDKPALPISSQPPAPLGAVELKPYDHQVGGHTTVYRFSRRAVCKQLNNRENEFYETVERQHPELLEFLPRYDDLRVDRLGWGSGKEGRRDGGVGEWLLVDRGLVRGNARPAPRPHAFSRDRRLGLVHPSLTLDPLYLKLAPPKHHSILNDAHLLTKCYHTGTSAFSMSPIVRPRRGKSPIKRRQGRTETKILPPRKQVPTQHHPDKTQELSVKTEQPKNCLGWSVILNRPCPSLRSFSRTIDISFLTIFSGCRHVRPRRILGLVILLFLHNFIAETRAISGFPSIRALRDLECTSRIAGV